jgi:integrase/recombinase XerD
MHLRHPEISTQLINHHGEQRILVKMPYRQDLIAKVKSIPGRKYSKTYKCWHLPNTKASSDALTEAFASEDKSKQTFYPGIINDFWLSKVETFKQYLSQQRYASKTISAYEQAVLQFLIWWDNRDISLLSIDVIREYNYTHFIAEKRSYSAQNIWINALKLFLTKEASINIDQQQIERPKKAISLPDILSEDEVRRLIDGYNNIKHKTIIMMYYSCGLRKSELINLKLRDLDSRRRVIRIRNSKGAKDRDVSMPIGLLKMIADYYRQYTPNEYLFNGQHSLQYSSSSIDKMLKAGIKKAGITKKITTHSLRHSYATHLVERNINLRFIQEALGHNSSRTTEIYTKLSKENIANMVSPIDFWDEI